MLQEKNCGCNYFMLFKLFSGAEGAKHGQNVFMNYFFDTWQMPLICVNLWSKRAQELNAVGFTFVVLRSSFKSLMIVGSRRYLGSF